MDINQFRQLYPQYNEVPDNVLIEKLHKKYYADKVDLNEFTSKFNPTGKPSIISKQPQQDEAGGPIESLIGGTKRYISSIRTALDLGDTAEDATVEGIKRQEGIKERPGFSMEDIKRAYKEEGLMSAIGETASQIPGTVAEQAPILGSIYAGGKAGFALTPPIHPLAKPAGAFIGSMLAPFLSMMGNNMERKAQEQTARGEPVDINRAEAAAFAAGQTALERVGLALSGVSKLLGIDKYSAEFFKKNGTEVVKELTKKNMGLAIAGGTGRYLLGEIPTEVGQQLLERSYAGLDTLSPDAMNEYGETMAQVALTGPIGSYVGYAGERKNRRTIQELEELEKTNLATIRADAEKRLREKTLEVEKQQSIEASRNLLDEVLNVSNFGLDYFVETSDILKQISPFETRIEELRNKAESALENGDVKAANEYIKEIQTFNNKITIKIDKFKDLKIEDIQKQTKQAIKGREFIANELQKIADMKAEVDFENKTPGLLTDNVLRHYLGLQRRSNTYKNAIGLDLNNPNNFEKFIKLLQDNQPNINQEAYDQYIMKLTDYLESQYDGKQIPIAYTRERDEILSRSKPKTTTRSRTDDGSGTTGDTAPTGLPDGRKSVEYTPLNASQDTITQTIQTLSNELQQTSDLEEISETGNQLENLNKLKTKLDKAKTKLAPKNLTKDEQSTLKTFLGEFVENTFRNQQSLQDPNVRAQYKGALDTIRDLDKQSPFKDTKYDVQEEVAPEAEVETAPETTRDNLVSVFRVTGEKVGNLVKDIGHHFGTKKQVKSIKKNLKDTKTEESSILIDPTNFLRLEEPANGAWANPIAVAENLRKQNIILPKDIQDKINAIARSGEAIRRGKNISLSQRDALNGINKYLKSLGYKGIVYKNLYEGNKNEDSYILFDLPTGPETEVETAPETKPKLIHDLYEASMWKTSLDAEKLKNPNFKILDSWLDDVDKILTKLIPLKNKVANQTKPRRDVLNEINKLEEEIASYHFYMAKEAGDPYQLPQTKLGYLISDLIRNPLKETRQKLQEHINELKKRSGPATDEYQEYSNKEAQPDIIQEILKQKNLRSALQSLKNNFSKRLNKAQAALIDRLLQVPRMNTTSIQADTFENRPINKPQGAFSPSVNRVGLNPDTANIVTVLHEAIHAATVSEINKHLSETDKVINNSKLGQQLLDMFNAAKEVDTDGQFKQPFKDVREFVAYGLTDEDFQKFLSGVRSYNAQESRISNLWNDFVNFVKEVLGLGDISNTVLNDLLSVSDDLLQGPNGAIVGQDNNTYFQEGETENSLDAPKRNSTGFFQGMLNKMTNPDVPKGSLGDLYLKARVNIANFYAKPQEYLMNKFNGAVMLDGQVRADLYLDQALHSNAVAAQAAEVGKAIFNNYGFAEVIEDDNNFNTIFNALNKLSESVGPEEARKIVQRYLAAKAFIGRQKLNDELQRKIDDLLDQAEYLNRNQNIEPDAKRRAKAARRKAAELDRQITKITDQQLIDSEEAVNEYSDISEIKAIENVIYNINLNHIDLMQQSGLITDSKALEYKNTAEWYVPLFRDVDPTESATKEYFRGFADLGNEFEFRGSEKQVLDILDNMIKKHFWIVNASMRNHANKKTAEAVGVRDEDGELKTYVSESAAPKNIQQNLAKVFIDGKEVWVEYADPEFAFAIQGSEVPIDDFGKYMSAFSKTLRLGVTSNPIFQAYQVVNDAIGSALFSGVKHPFRLALKVLNSYRVATMDNSDPVLKRMKDLGIVGGFYGYDTKDPLKTLRVKYKLESDSAIKKLVRSTDAWAANSDVSQRRALFEQTLLETGGVKNEDGSITGGNEILAMNRATNIINWQRRGHSGKVRWFVHLIPFANAYIQGADVLIQSARGKNIAGIEKAAAKKLFFKTAVHAMMLNFLYRMAIGAFGDDDDKEYASMDDRQKLRSYMIPGTGFKLPIRAELALITKMIPELGYNYYVNEGTVNEYDATKVMNIIGRSFADAAMGPNMVPQALRPAMEVLFNYDFFTDRPIVGLGYQEQETARQYSDYTSEMGKIAGKTGLISPLKFDHLIKGYFGTMGSMALYMFDSMATTLFDAKRPPLPLDRIPIISPLFYSPVGRARLNDFYELKQMSDVMTNSFNDMIEKGDYKAIQKLSENDRKLMSVRTTVLYYNRMLTDIRNTRTQVINGEMSEKEKMKVLENLQKAEYDALAGISKVRQSAGL